MTLFKSPSQSAEQCAVTTLYIEHHAWLRGWLAYRLRSWGRGVADDLAQDIFVRVLASRDSNQPDTLRQPRAYLTRIANCVLVSWRRRHSLEQAWLEALALVPEALQPSPEQQSVILETLHEIDAVLDGLRPRVSQAFLMATLDGMKQKDIAQALNIALPTVKKYIHEGYMACLSQMPDE
ncbi:sigma-70 family RNA polymerase sigma factor [Pseudomonas carassii]|uniref:Sigma-70 family RNA polymerase sigma factor n=1 Tax=Pseudomonas carassii TaxID=3115855 RepID=A0ABU7HHS2_9PSED|nr:sigma-70 family RNA polymerase sigma factor [Pseudomonas sp. 137P]MEE1890872.1 sigma-70 family RNA polymerase sigma factor [Pseudomonas sp. 137P]